ncbi:hypothetical protein AB1Y20_000689 [Prymnesium parvum]|uniref:Uncharacterized protein n=1 Tax=Prymnesium parvum TaxID=97485 RepID=A0AB34K9D4_PRYPA
MEGCPRAPAALQALHQHERCHCGPPNATEPAGRDHRPPARWGLPTHACPATPYLLHEYPQLHRRWLSEGRVLVHCSTSGGFGDYLRSIPSVVVLSMMLELALVLQCDVPTFDPLNPKREQSLHRHMPRLFAGPHFDWGVRVRLGSNLSASHAAAPSPAAFDVLRDLTAQQMRRYERAGRAVRVYSNAFAHARRLIKFNMAWARPRLGAYAEKPNEMDIDSCMLRYLLAPTERLLGLADAAMGVRTPRDGAQLLRVLSTHVRIGDAAFSNAEWSATPWKFPGRRFNPFVSNVTASLECILKASAAADGACLPCVVVSDSEEVIDCSKHALEAPVLTAGVAVHILASEHKQASLDVNIHKIFTDWWLLARSLVSVEFDAGSAFFGTANGYRLASSSQGKRVVFPGVNHTAAALARACSIRATGPTVSQT